jgi:hypothetical protein
MEGSSVAMEWFTGPPSLRMTAPPGGTSGRNPEDKVVKALHPGRRKRRRSSVAAQEVAPENCCDPLPTLTKKGIAVHKVRACIEQAVRQAECTGDEQWVHVGRLSAQVMSSGYTFSQLQMRGVTVPGNLDGTLVRNNAAHHRRPKQQQRR